MLSVVVLDLREVTLAYFFFRFGLVYEWQTSRGLFYLSLIFVIVVSELPGIFVFRVSFFYAVEIVFSEGMGFFAFRENSETTPFSLPKTFSLVSYFCSQLFGKRSPLEHFLNIPFKE